MNFPPNNQFDGVLNVWNCHHVPKIDISSSNPTDPAKFNLSNIFVFETTSEDPFPHFASEGNSTNKPFIKVHFTNQKLILTHYSLMSHDERSIRSWAIKGSNDDQSWKELHSTDNSTDLLDKKNQTYNITEVFPPYSYYLLELTESIGDDPHEGWTMRIRHFELFGDIIRLNPYTCGQTMMVKHDFFLLVLIML